MSDSQIYFVLVKCMYIHIISCNLFCLLHIERNLQVDRALSQDTAGYSNSTEEMHMQPHLSGSLSHDVWRKKAILRSTTGTQIHIRLHDGCERVPTLVV